LGLAACILIACSSSERFNDKIFDTLKSSEFIKSSTPIPCPTSVDLDGTPFEQKCWAFDFGQDVNEAMVKEMGQKGYQLGFSIAENIELEFVERTENGIFEYKSDNECSHFMIFEILEEDEANNRFEFSLAASKKVHCGEFTKT
jgi:hypothetical protein